MGSWGGETCGKAAAGRPSKVAECGGGWARLQLVDQVTDLASQSSGMGK